MTTVVEAPPAPSPGRERRARRSDRFRPDIQGLRAVAVTLVVLYHAGVPGVGGGYVGVDVFFVISGFLITGQLLGEVGRTGRIAVADFYARRARRLLPPAAVVVAATLVAAAAWEPMLRVRSLATDAVFTAVYGLNYRLAVQGVDYQDAGAPPSALQHFWSLAVEEQFYLLWPAVIVGVVVLARRRWRPVLVGVLAGVVVVSGVVSEVLVHDNAPLAYFSLQSRAWELGVGALVAVGGDRLAVVPRWVREAAAGVGVLVLVGVGCGYDDATGFPGWHAAVPVVATAAVIVAGCGGGTGVARVVLAPRPAQVIGTLSYPWYLWHWPVLVLAPGAVGRPLGWPVKVALAGVALVLAALTHTGVERPIVRSAAGRQEWLAVAALLTAVTTVAALLVGLRVSVALGALRPTPGRGQPTALYAPAGAADPFVGAVRGAVTPTVLEAVHDTPPHPAGCIVDLKDTVSPPCLIDPSGHETSAAVTGERVVLLGDSHAGQWFAPIHAVAASHGWSTEVLTKAGCPLPTLTVDNSALKRQYSECDTWRAGTLTRLAREPAPRIVFVTALNWYAQGGRLLAGWESTLARLRALGAPIVYLRDTPTPNLDVPTCLSSALPDWSRCAFDRGRALRPDPLAERATARRLGLAAVVDVDGYLCPASGSAPGATVVGRCPAVRGGVLLYRDASHVTSTAMTQLTPVIRDQLTKAGLPG